MTPGELADQWAAALDGATSGPWLPGGIDDLDEVNDADARFIAQARNLADETVAALRRYERLIEAVDEHLGPPAGGPWGHGLRAALAEAKGEG